ncbi:hypothetical protein OC835_000206 [Tilletia horrida]|nr:hypothetical protein OC835_000206 [Tilletia horrida]
MQISRSFITLAAILALHFDAIAASSVYTLPVRHVHQKHHHHHPLHAQVRIGGPRAHHHHHHHLHHHHHAHTHHHTHANAQGVPEPAVKHGHHEHAASVHHAAPAVPSAKAAGSVPNAAGGPPAGSGAGAALNPPVNAPAAAAAAKKGIEHVDSVANGASLWLAEVKAGQSKMHIALDAQFTDFVVNSGVFMPSAGIKQPAVVESFKVQRNDAQIATGKVFNDTFAISGLTLDKFPIAVGAQKWFKDGGDGLLGFAYAWTSEVNGQNVPFLWALKEAGAIQKAVLGLALWEDDPQAGISLGGPDAGKFKGPVEWVQIPEGYPFWSSMGKLGGVDVIFTLDTQRFAINAPRSVAESIFKTNPAAFEMFDDQGGALRAKVDCSKPPQLMIELGANTKVPVGGMTKTKTADGKCLVPLAGVDAKALPGGDLMAGAAFFSNLYMILDMEMGRIGYAARA